MQPDLDADREKLREDLQNAQRELDALGIPFVLPPAEAFRSREEWPGIMPPDGAAGKNFVRSEDEVRQLMLTVAIPTHFERTWWQEDHPEFTDRLLRARIQICDDLSAALVLFEARRPLSSKELRSIPWQKVIDTLYVDMLLQQLAGMNSAFMRDEHGGSMIYGAEQARIIDKAAQDMARQARTRRRVTPELLQEVADIYRAEGAAAVAETLVVGQRQANRYIARAREEGYLS